MLMGRNLFWEPFPTRVALNYLLI
ncbi:hypothetical protein F383_04503 [Gossypium arboreum]|uniref:Uncharacterized protein n=1 Tax=Gossypium arboreum TaxID=29729 RepID=A0A0B0NMM1_GOSAR|nr:hypothetical protein F383_16655 [Gossypium arboreum]KHG26404.1 hypothetical protein F383_04503 [Gossypium arboreum]